MTPTRLRECLTALAWSQRQLARTLDEPEGRVRMWARGTAPIPMDVAEWVERVTATTQRVRREPRTG